MRLMHSHTQPLAPSFLAYLALREIDEGGVLTTEERRTGAVRRDEIAAARLSSRPVVLVSYPDLILRSCGKSKGLISTMLHCVEHFDEK